MLQGKVAVITGSARGIGSAIVGQFVANRAAVFACIRKMTPELNAHFEKLREQYHAEIFPIILDVSDKESIKTAVKEIFQVRKTLDILVNNAGITTAALFPMTSENQFRNIFDTNFFGPVLLTQYLLKRFVSGGSIINISSSAALEANAGLSAYASSKSALLTWSRCLARELGERNIRVNVVAPGVTGTDILKDLSQDSIQKRIAANALKRMGQPAEIAQVVLYLASDKSSYVTGQVFRVDGGM